MKINDNGTNRDMTEAEQKAHEAWVANELAQAEAKAEAEAAKAAARQTVLDKLGLTANEAAALLG